MCIVVGGRRQRVLLMCLYMWAGGVGACVCACVRACVRACVHVCVDGGGVCAWWAGQEKVGRLGRGRGGEVMHARTQLGLVTHAFVDSRYRHRHTMYIIGAQAVCMCVRVCVCVCVCSSETYHSCKLRLLGQSG